MSFIFRPGGTKQPQLKQIPYYTAFNPRSIGTCALWLDAADPNGTGVQPSDGTTITTWIDKSGTSNHGTSGTATFQRDSLGPCINFTGSQSYTLTNSNGVVNQYFTIFVVEQLQNYAGGETGFMGGTTAGANQNLHMRYVNGGGGIKFGFYANDLDGSLTAFINNASQPIRIWSFSFTASSRVIYLNGVSLASDANNTYISGWSGARIGSILGGQFYNGKMREILIYSGTFTTTQRQQIESYLIQKWPVTVSLPSDHLHNTKPAGIPAVSIRNTRGFNLIAALLSAMSTVYTLSTYSLATIANSVSAASGTVSYIWTVAVPTGAKGKNAFLIIFFNLYSLTQFQANQFFDYGIYVDGVVQGFGDTGTARYVHTAAANYALNNGGITYGTNAMSPYQPLIIPLVLAAGATTIQLGISNSQSALSPIATTQIGYLSNNATSSGTSNTSNFVPQTLFTTAGSNVYTVPTTCSAGTVTGVFVYLWGSGGQGTSNGAGRACVGGAGGFVSGYYACAGGTNLIYIVGSPSGTGLASTGGSGAGGGNTGGQGYDGGGFSGIFLSNANGVVQANAIAIAGGGGGGGLGGNCVGGFGGYPTGGAPTQYGTGIVATAILGGSQTAGGIGTRNAGSALLGAPSSGPSDGGGAGGGGYYGGGSHAFSGVWAVGQATSYFGGAGGSSYVGSSLGASPSPAGIGLTSSAVTSNGNTSVSYTPSVPGGISSTYYPGGTRGYGDITSLRTGTGAVVIVPAVGANPVSVGVSATLYSV